MVRRYIYTLLIIFTTLAYTGCATANTTANTRSANSLEHALLDAVNQAFGEVRQDSRIAVIHIQAPNVDISNFILGEIQHILLNRRYNVVDRMDIDRIRSERDFQYSSEVDDNTAVSLGKFVGADLVVTGGIDGVGSFRRLRLKVIETQTTLLKNSASVPFTDPNLADEPKETPTKPVAKRSYVDYKLFLGMTNNSMRGLSNDAYPGLNAKKNSEYGGHLGNSLEIKLGQSPVSIEPGLRITMKPISYELPLWGEIATYYDNYVYLDFFVKLNLSVPIIPNVALQPFTGYSHGMLIDASSLCELKNFSNEPYDDIFEECNKTMPVIPLGIDLLLYDSLYIGYEYDFGLSTIWKDKYASVYINSSLLYIGYKF